MSTYIPNEKTTSTRKTSPRVADTNLQRLLKMNFTYPEIAKAIGCHPNTLGQAAHARSISLTMSKALECLIREQGPNAPKITAPSTTLMILHLTADQEATLAPILKALKVNTTFLKI